MTDGLLLAAEGILETKNFKGEALVVYHTSKFTGTHDTGVAASETECPKNKALDLPSGVIRPVSFLSDLNGFF